MVAVKEKELRNAGSLRGHELCSFHVPISRLNRRGGLRVDRNPVPSGILQQRDSCMVRILCAQPGMEQIHSFLVLLGISTSPATTAGTHLWPKRNAQLEARDGGRMHSASQDATAQHPIFSLVTGEHSDHHPNKQAWEYRVSTPPQSTQSLHGTLLNVVPDHSSDDVWRE